MHAQSSVIDKIRRNICTHGESVTFEFFSDDQLTDTRLTLLDLDVYARAVAVALQRRVRPGAHVLLLYPPGEYFVAGFLGTLYAGMVAVPVYPPNPLLLDRTLPRLRAIVHDSSAEVVLSTKEISALGTAIIAQVPELKDLPWLLTEEAMLEDPGAWREPAAPHDSMALLQYTSGSTGRPRGVVVTHQNLLSNARAITDNFGLTGADVCVSWLPFYHDMGLLGGVLQPLLDGISTIMMSPLEFMRRPMRWLEVIAARGATASGGPNFAFDLCVKKSTDTERANLDLSKWRVAFCGAEPVRLRTLTRFAEAFTVSGFDRSAFLPCYGLAEATLLVSGTGRAQGTHHVQLDRQALGEGRVQMSVDGTPVVSSGQIALEHEVAVVDPQICEPVSAGRVGELWVRGPSVAAGYWADRAATAETFGARLANDPHAYLRTGDLGFVHEGHIYVTGRLKEVMVVRGRNLYAHDLEDTAVSSCTWNRAGGSAAFSVETEHGEQCVIFQEIAKNTPTEQLPDVAAAIGAAVQEEHGISLLDVVLLEPRSLPKTSSGKVQRLASKTAYAGGTISGELYRRSNLAATHSEHSPGFLSRVELIALAEDLRVESIDQWLSSRIRCDVSELAVSNMNLDSLAAVELAFDIEEQLGVVIDPSVLLRPLSPREVAVAIADRLHAASTERVETELMEGLPSLSPLSAGQHSLLLMRELEGPDCQENVAVAVRLAGPVNFHTLGLAVRSLGDRHPILTSRFGQDGSRRWQQVDRGRPFELDIVRLAGLSETALRTRVDHCALAPFDIDKGEVARATLFVGVGFPVLVLAQHHVITDFWSVVTLLEELATIYGQLLAGRDLVLLPSVGYEEFVRWQHDYERSSQWQIDERYWLDLLGDEVTAPALPYRERSRHEPGVVNHRVTIGPELFSALERVAAERQATLFSVLMAAFQRLVGAHCGEDEFVVGTTTTGRPEARFRRSVGYFSNVIPIRVDLERPATVGELISGTARQLRESLEHQHFPYTSLVESLRARGTMSIPINTALIFERPQGDITSDVTSVVCGGGVASATLGDLRLAPFPIDELSTTQFDITVHVVSAGDGLLVNVLVRAGRFDLDFAELLAGQYIDLLGQIPLRLDSSISSLRLTGHTESLARADVASRATPDVTSVHELFESVVDHTPEAIALAAGDVELTYAEVDSRANRLAHELRRCGVSPEDKVGLCLRRSPDLIIAMLAVMKSGGAFVPLDPEVPRPRLVDMVEDARCVRILCHAETVDLAAALGDDTTRVDDPANLCSRVPDHRPDLVVGGGNLAYVIFTSGSTGRPKGAQVEHQSLASFLPAFFDVVDIVPGERVLQFAPLTFDACIEEIFCTWSRGATVVLRDEAVLDSPERFWAWCDQQRLALVDLPTAFFHVLVSALDSGVTVPRTLRTVLIAGEAVHPDKLAQWFAADRGHVDLFNRWGTTETTVCSTFALLGPDSGQVGRARDVSIGSDMTDAVVHVLDAALQPVPDGVVGQAYVGGAGVGRGYASAPRRTAERFVPDPFTRTPGRRLYATGDLVRRASDGELRYVGRADQQVKVRGYRIELGEIDVALRRHPDVAEAAVVALPGAGGTELVAAVTGEVTVPNLRDWLHKQLPTYMVPTLLLVLDRIPLTTNGKVDSRALRDHAKAIARSNETATMSVTESKLAALWCDVLDVPAVGLDEDFFSLGGHSLRAAGLNTRVRKEFGVAPPLRMFFESVTVRAQAGRIDELLAMHTPSESAVVAPTSVAPQVSSGQQRLWFLEKLAQGSDAYAVPGLVRLYGALDRDALRAALDTLVARHPLLRTGFHDDDGRPKAVVHDDVRFPFEVLDRTRVPLAQRESELAGLAARHARSSFDLDKPPLARAALVDFGTNEHVLLLAFHHIVFDGRSMDVVAGELAELYARARDGGTEPPAPAGDYSRWALEERTRLESATGHSGLEFWTRHLGDAPRALDLPFDRPRPALQTFNGARVPLVLGGEDSTLLRTLARQQQATIFMVLSACLASALSRLTGQERVVIGSPDANRPADGGYDDVVGFFVNTVPLCYALSGDETARELLDHVRATVLEAMPWRWIPFSAIVEAVSDQFDASRNPLFQAILDVHSGSLPSPAMPGLRVETAPLFTGTAKTDLTFEVTDDGGPLTGWLEYNSDLFGPDSARYIAQLFVETARAVARRPNERIRTPALSATLDQWTSTVDTDDVSTTFWSHFDRTATATPDAVAIEDEDRALTYGELRAQVEHVARVMAEQFALRAGEFVAVEMASSIEAVVAALAILRVGAVYVPVDPSYPTERKTFMLEDSGARQVVIRQLVEDVLSQPARTNPLPSVNPASPAYLLYTSGSTGLPKGALISHRSLANHAVVQASCFDLSATSRTLQYGSLSFDGSVWEVFATLASGGTICIASRDHALVGPELANVLRDRAITTCMLPPSVIASIPDCALPQLDTLLSAGEPCRGEHVARWQPGRRFLNGYGPTECTVMVTVADCYPGQPISLGATLPNATVHVLDADGDPAVTGAMGELYVAGAGVGIGYHNRPALTAEKFLPDPFSNRPGARMYRTGDLVRVRVDGTVEYCGRRDDQLKLRGYRIEPGEVESVLLAEPGVSDAVVRPMGAVLVAYVESADPAVTPDTLEKACARTLPAYLVPIAFVVRGELPRLPNGKLDAGRFERPHRTDYANATLTPLRSSSEREIGRVWSEVLDVDEVGARDNFFALGGHSLLATVVTARVSVALDRDIPLRALFEAPVLRDYAARCEGELRNPVNGSANSITEQRCDGDEGVALSVMQERLWILEELDRGSGQRALSGRYNLSGAVRLVGVLDDEALQRAVRRLVDRHTALRTVVVDNDGVLAQRVLDDVDVVVARFALSGATLEQRLTEARDLVEREAHTSVDLATGPLLRLQLLEIAHDDVVLVLTLHHIVGDGWSIEILKRDLAHFYADEVGRTPSTPLPLLDVTYQQFAQWQRHQLESGALDESVNYWCKQLNNLPNLELPMARRHPEPRHTQGNRVRGFITETLRAGIERLASESGGTVFMVLAAALQVTLGRLAGQRDFAIGAPVAGRRRHEVGELVGFFVNSVVLRADLSGNPSFSELLDRVRTTTIDAYEHQDVPFETLVDKLAPERDLSTTPLFRVYLNLLNIPPRKADLPGLTVETFAVPQLGAKFDLTFYVDLAESGISLDVVYATERFEAAAVDELLCQWIRVLEHAVADSGTSIDSMPLDTPTARRRLPDPNDVLDTTWIGSVVERFEHWAVREPQRIAVSEPGQEVSYGELSRVTAALAGVLTQHGVGKGDVVAIYGERCASLVWALLAVMRAGASFAILDPSHPAARTADCLMVSRPTALLELEAAGAVPDAVTEALHAHTPPVRMTLPTKLIDARHAVPQGPVPPDAVPVGPHDCAYIAFTSGSAGKPKGVRGAHGSLTHFVPWMVETFDLRGSDRYSMLSGIGHDPLHREVFTPLSTGATICVPALADVEDPDRLVRWLRTEQISVSHLTPPMARLFDQSTTGPGTLPALRRVFFTGDVLTGRDVRAVTRFAGTATCVNLYGSTESQRAVGYFVVPTVDENGGEDPGTTYPLGRGVRDVQLLVFNEAGVRAGIGEPGEIAIRSPHIALGYVDDDELTAARFTTGARKAGDDDRTYRTGDLGRYALDGSVLPLGRMDNQVKIRGYRVETDEVRHVIGLVPGVRDAVVVAREDTSGETSLVAYVIPDSDAHVTADEVKAFVRDRLPEHMVPAFVVELDAFPLTPNHKIDRTALPEPSTRTGRDVSEPPAQPSPTEELIAGIWQDVLGAPRVLPDDNFFNLGGHSLMAARVMSRVRQVFGRDIGLRALFEKQTVRQFAAHVDGMTGAGTIVEPVTPLPRTGPLPSSYGQERLWILDQIEGDTRAYNTVTAVRLRGRLDTAALSAALKGLVRRHEVLRTRLVMAEGSVNQSIDDADDVSIPLDTLDLSAEPEQAVEQRWRHHVASAAGNRFDLARAPLGRATLIRVADEHHVFVLVTHHVVADAWALQVLVRDFASMYQAHRAGVQPPLPPLRVQYADWAAWQRTRFERGDYQSQLDFWRAELAEPAPLLTFPAQRPRPAVMTNRGTTARRVISGELVAGAREIARQNNATLFMALLAVFNCQLHRYSGAGDIAVGIPVATRSAVETEDVAGFFVNTVVSRNTLSGDDSFTQLLDRVRRTTLAAFANQDVPFDRVVEALQPSRDLSTSPLFQVMFVLHNAPYSRIDLDGLSLERLDVSTNTAKFDLSLDLAEEGDGLLATLELNADLFDPEAGEQILAHFESLLSSVVSAPQSTLTALEIRPEAEARAQEALCTGPKPHSPPLSTPAQALEHWSRRTPDARAVIDGNEVWSYRELRDLVATLAARLAELTSDNEPAVVVCARRSARHVAAAIACGAVGATYVPISPALPDRRIATMLDKLGDVVVVTDDEQRARIDVLTGGAYPSLELGEAVVGERTPRLHHPHPHCRAYVIFTSGTTGEPKGVVVEQAGLLNHLQLMTHTLGLSEKDVIAQTASQSFDISVWQMLVAVTQGATTVVSDDDTSRDAATLAALVRERQVTVLQLVPGMIRSLLDHADHDDLRTLRHMIATGEELAPDLCAKWLRRFPDIPLVNAYGPAECSDDTHLAVLSSPPPLDRAVTIGRPVAGVTSYVVDEDGLVQPFGVPGELAVGGVAVGRGYLGDPRATAERFVPDPFSTRPGARLYRTGDRVRLLRDGRLEFLGRLDDQVKIRGSRIEVGEVEAALRKIDDVTEAAVVVHGSGSAAQLVACVAGGERDPGGLTAALAARLPQYLLPSGYVFVDQLPRSSNGKIDRAALRRDDLAVERVRRHREELTGPTERLVASVFESLLDTPSVGALDDFFELGGNSLLGARLVSELSAHTGVDLPLRVVFDRATVRHIASVIEESQLASLSEAERREVQALLAAVTDEEARAMLASDQEGGA